MEWLTGLMGSGCRPTHSSASGWISTNCEESRRGACTTFAVPSHSPLTHTFSPRCKEAMTDHFARSLVSFLSTLLLFSTFAAFQLLQEFLSG